MDLFIYCANKYNYIAILRTHMELHTHTHFLYVSLYFEAVP